MSLVEAMLAEHATANQQPDRALTLRRHEVLRLVAHGLSNVDIGRQLYVAVDTVKGDLRALFQDLGAKNRAHAVAIGFRKGIIR